MDYEMSIFVFVQLFSDCGQKEGAASYWNLRRLTIQQLQIRPLFYLLSVCLVLASGRLS